MKFALIPFTKDKLKDSYFFEIDSEGRSEFVSEDIRSFWQYFNDRGDTIHTIDLYDDFEDVDYFLVFNVDWRWICKIIQSGNAYKMIYCNAEPPTVMALNCPQGFKKLKLVFPYILTWNRDWVDNERIFIRNIPYHFCYNAGNVPYEERKLLTAITANKRSRYKHELYSERKRAYQYFERELPGEFVFFGTGWNKYRHLGYGGVVNDKFSTYHGYKFALCLENTKGMRDYVTEKIFDCLCSGIVPIYGGAPNIKEYVPKECFIDYFDFNNLDELKQFIIEMDRDTYHRYLEAGKKLVCGRIQQQYTKAKYAECIYEAIKTKVEFEITLRGKIIAKCRLFCQLCKELM